MISFTPIFDRVLIKRCDSGLSKKVSKAGLVLPDNVKDSYKASQGIVVTCGTGCHEDVQNLTGKEVLFARYSGDDIVLNGEEYVLMSDRDVFGGINNDTISE